jgi:hypothetical protein
MLAAAAAVLVLLVGGGTAYVLLGDKDKDNAGGPTPPTSAAVVTSGGPATATSAAAPTTAAATSDYPALAPDEVCSDEIKANARWVCITDVTFDGKQVVIKYTAKWDGSTPDKHSGYHVHFYSGDGTEPMADSMGTQADAADRGKWYIEDENPSIVKTTDSEFKVLDLNNKPKICARIAKSNHNLVPEVDQMEGFHTGNCWPVRRI